MFAALNAGLLIHGGKKGCKKKKEEQECGLASFDSMGSR